ncbi:hypothetical protein C8J57DRAFT_1332065 [Mycena rebaudengoi]|nr:hypothetical protein C8J57DRAFT_1332065 [Mycena rebaudengoi]
MPTVILLRAGLRVLFRYLLCHSHGLHLRRPLRYFWQGSPGFFWGAIIWRAIIWRRKTANLLSNWAPNSVSCGPQFHGPC